MEQHAAIGTLEGNVITLEDSGLDLDPGQRVRVIIEPLLSDEEQRLRWKEWSEEGPQGPIGAA